MGGTADERRQRIRGNMPEFKEAHGAMQAPVSHPVVVVGVVVNPLQPVVAAVIEAAASPHFVASLTMKMTMKQTPIINSKHNDQTETMFQQDQHTNYLAGLNQTGC